MSNIESPSSSAWTRLQDGNRRWVDGNSTAERDRGAARRAQLSDGQTPFAVVLGCSDSRVPAEILFDQGLGDLFVVRTAGHVLDTAVLGSVEYAVAVLNVSLIVVLGHEGCGAVAAAGQIVDEAQVPPSFIRDVAERIAPDVVRARRAGAVTPAELSAQHSLYTIDQLRQRSSLIDAAVELGAVTAVPVQYSLRTGVVTEVQPLGAALVSA